MYGNRKRFSVVLAGILAAAGQEDSWVRQFGTSERDIARSVAVDGSGQLYVVGYTSGTFPGQTSFGVRDAYVRGYDSNGDELWTRQFGSQGHDVANDVALDAGGNLYIAGFTSAALPSQTNLGGHDAYLTKYGRDGSELWTRQFGTRSDDFGRGVIVDGAGNVYVAGTTTGILAGQTNLGDVDSFVSRFDSEGKHRWTRQFGTPDEDTATDVAADVAGNVYVVGWSFVDLPGTSFIGFQKAYLNKYTSDGAELWAHQFGTLLDDFALGIAVGAADSPYVVGYTRGAFPGEINLGEGDAFVRSYQGDGRDVWTRQFGSEADIPSTFLNDSANGIGLDAAGNLYLAGWTQPSLPGQSSHGLEDVYVRKYDSAGTELWTQQLGTPLNDFGLGIAVDGAGHSYIVGYTLGAFPEHTNSGEMDAFVARLSADGPGGPAEVASEPAQGPEALLPASTSTPAPDREPSSRGRGCYASSGGTHRVEAGWMLVSLLGPGMALAGLRRRWPPA